MQVENSKSFNHETDIFIVKTRFNNIGCFLFPQNTWMHLMTRCPWVLLNGSTGCKKWALDKLKWLELEYFAILSTLVKINTPMEQLLNGKMRFLFTYLTLNILLSRFKCYKTCSIGRCFTGQIQDKCMFNFLEMAFCSVGRCFTVGYCQSTPCPSQTQAQPADRVQWNLKRRDTAG